MCAPSQVSTQVTHHPMELAALIALRLAPTVLGLAGAELSKVLSSLGYYVLVQLDLDSA